MVDNLNEVKIKVFPDDKEIWEKGIVLSVINNKVSVENEEVDSY